MTPVNGLASRSKFCSAIIKTSRNQVAIRTMIRTTKSQKPFNNKPILYTEWKHMEAMMRSSAMLAFLYCISCSTSATASIVSSRDVAFMTGGGVLPFRGCKLATNQKPSVASSLVFLAGRQEEEYEPVASSRRQSTSHVSPVMMGRAAAKRAVKKGKTDGAKAKLYSRYGKMVTMCVKAGGSDPVSNTQLSKLLQQAKQAGVPTSNMENCIKRAVSKEQADYKESTYEVYAHGGIGFVLDILTDNSNRAAGDVRTVVNKNKLKIAEPGSVAFNFDRVGCVTVETDKDEDTVTEAALEAGAEDLAAINTDGDDEAKKGFNIFTETTQLMAVAESIREQGYSVVDARFIWKPKANIEVAEADEELNLEVIELLEELDDVDAVFHNMA